MNDVNLYKLFFNALQADRIDAVVETAYEYFGVPVLLTDENYMLICQCPKKKIGQEIWDTLFDTGTLPNDVIMMYQKLYLDIEKPFYEPFYSDSGLSASYPRIYGEVYSPQHIYGHVAVFKGTVPLDDRDMEAMDVFIEALKMLMQPRRSRSVDTLSSYLKDILNRQSSPEVRALALQYLSSRVKGAYTIMATPLDGTASQRAYASMTLSGIRSRYEETICTIDQDCIVTLFGSIKSCSTFSDQEKDRFGRVASYLSPTHAPSGISRPFSSLREAPGHFEQAYMTARVTDKPYEFFDHIFPLEIFAAAADRVDASMFTHPALEKMRQYDLKNKTEYDQTLKIYCFSLCNKDKTAKELMIHRNTLLYRLNRITELFGISMDDPKTVLALLNSYQLMEAVKKRAEMQR